MRRDLVIGKRERRKVGRHLVMALACVVTPARTAWAQSGYDLFQQALVLERTNGDVRQAITIYRKIIEQHPDDRTLTARTLVRLGRAYETVDRPRAIGAYERVIRDFAEQRDPVSEARTRLAVLRPPPANDPTGSQVTRLLATDEDNCEAWNMQPSPDGRRILSVDYCYTGALRLRDVASGEVESITDAQAWHISAVWSPDGNRVLTAATAPGQYRVYILDVATRAETMPAALQGLIFAPWDWSADTEHVAGTVRNADGTVSSVVISLDTGVRFTLAARVNQGGSAAAFSPDGRFVAFTDFADDNQDIYVMTIDGRARYRVTDDPRVDDAPVWSPDGSRLLFQNTGGAWVVEVANGQRSGEPQLVRDTPFEYPAEWLPSGFYYSANNAVARLHAVAMDTETGRRTGDLEPLPIQVEAPQWLAWSPDMRRLATASWEERLIRIINGETVTEVGLGTEILVSNLWWSSDGEDVLFTTADRAQRRRGWKTVFALDPDEGEIRELFPRQDSINHLHLSPDGTRMTFLRNTPTRRMAQVVVAPLGDPNGTVLATGNPADGPLATRFGQPLFSPTGEHVLFMRGRGTDGQGGSLWVVRSDGTEAPRAVARAPYFTGAFWDPSGRRIAFQTNGVISVVDIETGTTHEVVDREEIRGQLKAWAPDGRWIVVSVTTGAAEFWVVEDLLGKRDQR